jgi:hypothetical protein
VQLQKWIFFDKQNDESIHAVDSVELVANKNIIPLRTIAPQTNNHAPQHNKDDGAVKGQVKFKALVEYVLEFDDEDEEMNVAPRMIECEETGNGEEWSMASGSTPRGDWKQIVTQGELIAEQPSGSAGNYYNVLQEESESGSAGNDEGLSEERQCQVVLSILL